MIENTNASKEPSNGEYVDYKKFIGAANIKVKAINPTNDWLREKGWQIPEGADEPKYQFQKERDGKTVKYFRVRFVVEIQNLDDKPLVFLDFLCSPDVRLNKDGDKAQIIDWFVRTAWATKDDIKNKRVPQYTNGSANISMPYKMCHQGEETLLVFLHRLLNVTAMSEFNRATQKYEPTKNPGRISFDDWAKIAEGNNKEIAEMLSERPDNTVMVILGVQTTPDNKTYQTFLNYGDIQHAPYFSSASRVNANTGEYDVARRRIDAYNEQFPNNSVMFSAAPVKEWTVTPTDVKEASSDLPADDNDLPADDNWSTGPDGLPF